MMVMTPSDAQIYVDDEYVGVVGGAAHEGRYPGNDSAHVDDVAVLQSGIGVADGQYAFEVIAQLLVA